MHHLVLIFISIKQVSSSQASSISIMVHPTLAIVAEEQWNKVSDSIVAHTHRLNQYDFQNKLDLIETRKNYTKTKRHQKIK